MDGNRNGAQSGFQLRPQLMGPLGHACFADPLMEFEGLRQGPQFVEGLVAAGRHPAGRRRTFRVGPEDQARQLPLSMKLGIVGRRDALRPLRTGYDARPARAEEPLITTGHEEVAAEIGEDG